IVGIVSADDWRQFVLGTIELQCARFPIVTGENARLRLVLSRHGMIHIRHSDSQLFPAEAIRKMLREDTAIGSFGFYIRAAHQAHIRRQDVHWQYWDRQWSQHDPTNNQEGNVMGPQPSQPVPAA